MNKFLLSLSLLLIISTSSCAGTQAAVSETWSLVELLSKGERTDVVPEIVEVRNCGSPERKTTNCSAGTSNDLSVSLGGGVQFGEGVMGTIDAEVTTSLGIGRDSGESIELELPPSGFIYRYNINKTYRVLAGKVLARSSSGKEQEGEYAFHASCSITIQGRPEEEACENTKVEVTAKPMENSKQPVVPNVTEHPNNPSSTTPEQFIRDYFEAINNRQYEQTWAMLSDYFKENHAAKGLGGFQEYVDFWDKVDSVEIILIRIDSQTASAVYIYVEAYYHYKNGTTTTGHTTYKLVKNAAGDLWLFDPN